MLQKTLDDNVLRFVVDVDILGLQLEMRDQSLPQVFKVSLDLADSRPQ